MSEITALLGAGVQRKASDTFIIAGLPVSYKIEGEILPIDTERIMPDRSNELISALYALAGRDMNRLFQTGDDDFSISIKDLSRFRVCAYRQRGSLAAVIRTIAFGIPSHEKLGIPEEVMRIADKTQGLVLITGPAGSGKSTTQACIVDRINRTRNAHIITIEDPIEYLHRNDRGVITQREVGSDTESYVAALRASLRQAPNVILLGEMRDLETIKTAMTAAETGHLVISTLHTIGAVNSIDRIIDVFPPDQQQQIRIQLSMALESVVTQRLISGSSGEQIPVFEIMHLNPAIRNMIRDEKIHQIDSVIATSTQEGMRTMDSSLLAEYRAGRITEQSALGFASNVEQMQRRLKG